MMKEKQRNALRKAILRQRTALSLRQQQHTSWLIAKKIVAMPSFLASKRIAFYRAHKGEVDPLPLLQQALRLGKECYLPILHPCKPNRMWFGRFEPGVPLKKNCYGIYEPDPAIAVIVAPWALDVVIVPVVAFDSQRNRLGMGGGYYDRTFSFLQHGACTKPALIGLAYSFQQADLLPWEDWDIGLDSVVTEKNII